MIVTWPERGDAGKRAMIDAMPNGKPGDHPLTDITVHHLEVFGEACDDLIREIYRRDGPAVLDALDLWSLDPRYGHQPDLATLAAKLRNLRDRTVGNDS